MWATAIDPQYRHSRALSGSRESDLHNGVGLTLQGISACPARVRLMVIIHAPAICSISNLIKMSKNFSGEQLIS